MEFSKRLQLNVSKRPQIHLASKVKSIKDRLMEVELGFDRKIGLTEALRCINCDIQTVFTASECIECDACIDICPTQCLTMTPDAEEGDLLSHLTAPRQNREQPLFVSGALKQTSRVMVKDENLCVHCSLLVLVGVRSIHWEYQ